MVLEKTGQLDGMWSPLRAVDIPAPEPGPEEILIRVSACAVCHTELDEIEGRTPPPRFPVIPGHQVVGSVVRAGTMVRNYSGGELAGVGWIFAACGTCEYCLSGRENLCAQFTATGRDVHGGYAEFICVREDFAHKIPPEFSDVEAAPLLCAGAIGYRSLRVSGLRNGQILGLTGFGASGHLVLQLVKHRFPDTKVFVFARTEKERAFARELGADWAGGTEEPGPEKIHCIIDTTPAWKPVVDAMQNLRPGGRLVVNAIRKEESDKEYLLKIDYPRHLWLEKEIVSVANVTRADIREFLGIAVEIPIKPEIEEYPLERANEALMDLKTKKIRGAKVLRVHSRN